MVIECRTVQLSAQDVGRSKLETAQTGRKLNFFIIGTLALIFVFLIVERVFIANVGEPRPATVIVAEPDQSVAELPIVDLSNAWNQEWFADGLTHPEWMNYLLFGGLDALQNDATLADAGNALSSAITLSSMTLTRLPSAGRLPHGRNTRLSIPIPSSRLTVSGSGSSSQIIQAALCALSSSNSSRHWSSPGVWSGSQWTERPFSSYARARY